MSPFTLSDRYTGPLYVLADSINRGIERSEAGHKAYGFVHCGDRTCTWVHRCSTCVHATRPTGRGLEVEFSERVGLLGQWVCGLVSSPTVVPARVACGRLMQSSQVEVER
eukprot:4771265-Prymnesium_polylepis.2